MPRLLSLAVLTLALSPLSAADPIAFGPDDWPWWRGPNRDGHADPKQQIPLEWSETKNVVWKAPVPGRGHGSPCVVGRHVYLASADMQNQVQSVHCFDRATGKELWKTDVHKGGLKQDRNVKSSLASCTPACDGQRVFVNFLNNDAVYATALDLTGKQLWQERIDDYVNHQGFGASPAVYGPLLLVAVDHKGGGALAGLDRETGKAVWTRPRAKVPNYSSPIVLKLNGKDQLILTGTDLVTSLDPLTGKENWEVKGATTECVTSTITDGTHVFTSGGYPKNHVAAVKADGSGKVAWENGTRVYVPSMLVKDGHLFAVQDAGTAVCWASATGKEVWSGRLRGTFSSSPVLVGEHILATNEAGRTFVFKASLKGLEVVAENQLGDDAFATPTVCGGRIYHRVATVGKGSRQEWLYCLGR
ncbi:MAG TPA: PQQ-binding-like beta-propeller repeat protein [Gemmataceae bacterium]|jgi:outer membrane protein assembly factor BamB|nr:PQQ-binding-like beta-propeller repeat protein [Gemmataceae bacterium]